MELFAELAIIAIFAEVIWWIFVGFFGFRWFKKRKNNQPSNKSP